MPIAELSEQSPRIIHPKGMKIKLKDHQLTSIQAMNQLEETGAINKQYNAHIERGHIYTETDYMPERMRAKLKNLDLTIYTNFGILSDVVGSGKTYIVVGLLYNNLLAKEHDKILPSSMFCAMKYKDFDQTFKTNFIIVPHNLITQWKIAFSYCNLKTYIVARHSDIDYLQFPDNIFGNANNLDSDIKPKSEQNKDDFIDENDDTDVKTASSGINFTKEQTVEYYDAVICSANMAADYLSKFPNIKYSRIVIDEICSIRMPPELEWKANFIWFVTATPSGICRINRNYIKHIVSGINNFVFDNIIIKNNDEYVSKSMSLPTINQILIKCFTPKELELIREYVPQEVVDMLNAGNMSEAIIRLNCNIDTNENILEVLTKKIAEDIHNRTAELQYQETRIVIDKKTHDEYLDKLRGKLQSVHTKLEAIVERIKKFKEDNCPVCFDDFKNEGVQVGVFPCCSQLMCVVCISNITNGICPMCRALFMIKNIHVISDKSNNTTSKAVSEVTNEVTHEVTKMDAVIKIIKTKTNGKFLLFSNYDQTFDNLLKEFDNNNIKYSKVMGTIYTINKILARFIAGEIQVLMLNALQYGSGLNLQMATDIIIYHQLTLELETQVIGRAQRIGRILPLTVYYLLFNHEKHNVDSPTLSLDLNTKHDESEFNKHLGLTENIYIPQLADDEIPAEIFGNLLDEDEEEADKPTPTLTLTKTRKPRAKKTAAINENNTIALVTKVTRKRTAKIMTV